MDTDVKGALLWSLVGLAAAGGLYGTYVKIFGKAAYSQANAYSLLLECTALLNSDSQSSIEELILKANKGMPEIQKSDAVATGVTIVADADHQLQPANGDALRMCLAVLNKRLDELRPSDESGRS